MNKIKEAIEQFEDLKIHCEYVQNIDECTDHTLHIKAINTAIEVLPLTIDAEPVRHGRNITTEHPVDEFICSECKIHLTNYVRVEIEDDAHYEYTMKYCPNCGAKMDLEE